MDENKPVLNKFTIASIKNMFRIDILPSNVMKAEKAGRIPEACRESRGKVSARYWTVKQLPAIGAELGKLPRLPHSVIISSYIPKGGVGKTTWTFNFARLIALHGIKTLVVGADFQCSISKSFGIKFDSDSEIPISLYDVIQHKIPIEDAINNSDIPTLDFIAESPELTLLDRYLISQRNREHVLTRLLEPLKARYDCIIIDCPPQWNELVTNALIASDAIICPVLADGESDHSFKMFMRELKSFVSTMEKTFTMVKFVPNGVDIRNKFTTSYQKKFLNDYPAIFTTNYLRNSVFIQEASELNQSIAEYDPKSGISEDVYNAIFEVWTDLIDAIKAEEN